MKNVDINRGWCGIIVGAFTIIASVIVIYTFITGNTRFPPEIFSWASSLGQSHVNPVSTSVTLNPTPTPAPTMLPTPTPTPNLIPTPTSVTTNEGSPSETTISYDFWTWFWWSVSGFIVGIFIALGGLGKWYYYVWI